MSEQISLKRTFLWMLIGAVSLSALMGVFVLLAGDIHETELRILLTTLSVSYFSVTSLGCAAALEKQRAKILSGVGITMAAVGFVCVLPGIWGDAFRSEGYAKTMMILAMLSFSFAHASLLTLANLESRYRWALPAAIAAIFALAAMISALILEMFGGWSDDFLVRMIGVVGIVDAALTITVPILARLSSQEEIPHREFTTQDFELSCPRCGRRGFHRLGVIQCKDCGLKLRVELLDDDREVLPSRS